MGKYKIERIVSVWNPLLKKTLTFRASELTKLTRGEITLEDIENNEYNRSTNNGKKDIQRKTTEENFN